MAKEVKARLKMQIAGGSATPAPPVGSALGPQGVSAMEFCKQFNAATADRRGQTCPVKVTVYTDRTFEFVVSTPPASELIRKKAGIAKGSSKTGSQTVGKISWAAIEEIAKIKLPDLNAHTLEAACLIIAGTARSMGLIVEQVNNG
jgi:large subunit ribosomal protein L11